MDSRSSDVIPDFLSAQGKYPSGIFQGKLLVNYVISFQGDGWLVKNQLRRSIRMDGRGTSEQFHKSPPQKRSPVEQEQDLQPEPKWQGYQPCHRKTTRYKMSLGCLQNSSWIVLGSFSCPWEALSVLWFWSPLSCSFMKLFTHTPSVRSDGMA